MMHRTATLQPDGGEDDRSSRAFWTFSLVLGAWPVSKDTENPFKLEQHSSDSSSSSLCACHTVTL